MDDERKRLSKILQPEEIEVFALVGIALNSAQSVEQILRLVMTFVLQKGDRLDLLTLEAQEAAERKKTIGYFLRELRKRAGIAPGLDKKLDSFLERRNLLAHNLHGVPGWGPKTAKGQAAGRAFLMRFIDDSHELLIIFVALANAWQKDALPGAALPRQDLVDELTKDHVPMLDELFFAKD